MEVRPEDAGPRRLVRMVDPRDDVGLSTGPAAADRLLVPVPRRVRFIVMGLPDGDRRRGRLKLLDESLPLDLVLPRVLDKGVNCAGVLVAACWPAAVPVGFLF
jgi:hypothetical protein